MKLAAQNWLWRRALQTRETEFTHFQNRKHTTNNGQNAGRTQSSTVHGIAASTSHRGRRNALEFLSLSSLFGLVSIPRSPTRLAPAAPRPNLLLSPFSELRTPNDDVQGRGSISILGAT
jgi:hypothetical protein